MPVAERREAAKARRARGEILGASLHTLTVEDNKLLEARECFIFRATEDVVELELLRAAKVAAAAEPVSSTLLQDGSAAVAQRLASRIAFVGMKKAPQIQWITALVSTIMPKLGPSPLLIEIGGGRGGLADALASAFPLARVVSIDGSPAAVAAGSRDSAHLGNLQFVCAQLPGVNLEQLGLSAPAIVLGLHSCGGLTDAALSFALESRAGAFLFVPCCATKNKALWGDDGDEELGTVRRLAESPDRSISERAMRVLNNARLARAADKFDWFTTRYLLMPRELSARNHVILGIRDRH